MYRQLESRCISGKKGLAGTNKFWPKMYKIFIPWSIHSMTVQPFCPLYLVYQVPKDNLLEGWVPVYLSDVCFISLLNILDRATTVSSEAGTWQFCKRNENDLCKINQRSVQPCDLECSKLEHCREVKLYLASETVKSFPTFGKNIKVNGAMSRFNCPVRSTLNRLLFHVGESIIMMQQYVF